MKYLSFQCGPDESRLLPVVSFFSVDCFRAQAVAVLILSYPFLYYDEASFFLVITFMILYS